jgi:predicted Zn-dependent protease
MRDDLLAVHQLEPASKEAAFGLGLYDYYADVLPRVLKILRFFLSIPGGSRQRGLARIEEARRGPAVHQVEAQAQLYEIYAFYERKPDRALQEIRGLRERFPGSPLWAFRLAEHLRERMGLYAESAEVCREIVRAADEARPNYAPVVGAMARVYLGEALLLDLRLPEARRAVAPVLQGEPQAPWVGPRAQMVVGTSLEIEGDRRGAEAYYRAAAGGASRETRVRAHDALESPLRPGEVRGRQLLAEARRLAESGKADQAVATARQVLEAWPDCAEASARVADADLQEGRLARARPVIERLARAEDADPPWVRPWARLLLAQAHDLAGNRPAALRAYKEVWNEPCGRADLRARAAAGLRRPFTRGRDGGRGPGAR